MTAQELLARQLRRQIDTLFRAAKALPEEKLDWSPSPDLRSALSQLQEAATTISSFWAAHAERKIEWSPEFHQAWMGERAKLTTLEELEAKTRADSERLIEFILATANEDLSLPVQMPFPGEYLVADILGYHAWNMAYHEGQITYIGFLYNASTGKEVHLTDSAQKLMVNNCNLEGSEFTNVNLAEAKFEDINLRGTHFHNINMAQVEITNANVSEMKIEGVEVSDLLAAYQNRIDTPEQGG